MAFKLFPACRLLKVFVCSIWFLGIAIQCKYPSISNVIKVNNKDTYTWYCSKVLS